MSSDVDVVPVWWRCGGSLVDMWWLIGWVWCLIGGVWCLIEWMRLVNMAVANGPGFESGILQRKGRVPSENIKYVS